MIFKFFKTIHNKYSAFFNFIFFIRYLFLIFFISLIFFFTIPKFFNYEKREDIFKNYLSKNFDLKINKYEKIDFYVFPIPNIQIKNVEIKLDQISSNLYSSKISIYPKILSIYNHDNFQGKKIILHKAELKLKTSESIDLIKNILNQKKNFSFQNLNLEVSNNDKNLINIKNVNFSNYGYSKNTFSGKIFDQKFKLKLKENMTDILFKIPDIKLQAYFNLKNTTEKLIAGNSKIRILDTNLKFNFIYSNKKFEILNTHFRNKDLSFKGKSIITFVPYFETNSSIVIEDINLKILKGIDFTKLLKSKNIIKKINSKNKIIFKSKRFSGDLIEELTSSFDLAYGRLNYEKIIKISGSLFKCKGSVNFYDEQPLLDFDCSINARSKKEFLNIFSIKQKNKGEVVDLKIKGNLNFVNNKINLKNVFSGSYRATIEDLNYFNKEFENFFFKQHFLDIFDLKKIKNFILEIS